MLAEWKRILCDRRVLLWAVLLLTLNLLLFGYICSGGAVAEVRQQTVQRMGLLNDYRSGQVTQQDVEQEFTQLQVMTRLLHYKTTKQLYPQEYILMYREEEISLRNEYPQIADCFDQGMYEEEDLQNRYCLLDDFLMDLSYPKEYQKQLEQLRINAQAMQNVAVFSKNANIQKTEADHTGMESIPISVGNDLSTLKLLSYGWPSVFCLMFSLVLVTTALEERRWGLLPLLHSCKNGRGSLILWRVGGLLAGGILFAGLICGTTMLASVWLFGPIEPERTVQSIPELFGITAPMSLIQLWGRYLILGILVQVMLIALVYGLFDLSEHRILGFFLLAVILGGAALLYRLLPDQSPVAFLKYTNPVAAMDFGKIIGTYRNIDFGIFLVERKWLVYDTLIAAPIILLPVIFWHGHRSYAVAEHGGLSRFLRGIIHGYSILYHRAVSLLPYPMLEGYRVLILRRGGVVLLALLLLLAVAYRPKTPIYVGEARILQEFYEQFGGGGITQEVLAYTGELQAELTEVEEQWQQATDAYRGGKMSAEQYELAYRVYEAYELRRQAFEQIQSRLEYIRQQESLGYDALLVEPTAYEYLLTDHNADRIMEKAALFALAVLCAVACSQDAKGGLPELLRSTPKGRGWLAWHAAVLSLLFSVGVCALLKGARLYGAAAAYGLPQLWAPSHSLEAFAGSALKVSIAGALVIRFLQEWLIYAGVSMATAAVCLIRRRRSV